MDLGLAAHLPDRQFKADYESISSDRPFGGAAAVPKTSGEVLRNTKRRHRRGGGASPIEGTGNTAIVSA
jgi:hypothetical protein